MSTNRHPLPYSVGTRYSNSEWYDEATDEVITGGRFFAR